jgi:hypothetical protein
MDRNHAKMRNFAGRLIAYETKGHQSSGPKTPVAFPAMVEKLRPHLSTLMGNGGFRALLSRALVLANAEVPWLRAVRVKADGSLEGLDELQAQVAPEEVAEGRMVLLAQLLGLLVTFIGERLTLRLMQDVWPKFPTNHLDFNEGDKNEKTK